MKNNLKKLRKYYNITQCRLSKETGISNQLICDFEKNRGSMSIKNLIKLADYFDISLDILLDRKAKQIDLEKEVE